MAKLTYPRHTICTRCDAVISSVVIDDDESRKFAVTWQMCDACSDKFSGGHDRVSYGEDEQLRVDRITNSVIEDCRRRRAKCRKSSIR